MAHDHTEPKEDSMRVLRICDVGLSKDASNAFHSMLGIVAGRSRVEWVVGGIDDADVLLAHVNADSALLARWIAAGKPLVSVIGPRESRPPLPFVLRHPFRVMQLLSMLDEVAEYAERPAQDGGASARDGAWELASSLHRLDARIAAPGWHVSCDARGDRLWIGGNRAHAKAHVLQALRTRGFAGAPFEIAGAPPPSRCESITLGDAAWHIGIGAPGDLAPWLDAHAYYRLHRWPDLGRLGADPLWIELSAIAAARAFRPVDLVDARPDVASTHRYLTACSLAGLLVPTACANAPPLASPIAGGWTRLLGTLRRHLGMPA